MDKLEEFIQEAALKIKERLKDHPDIGSVFEDAVKELKQKAIDDDDEARAKGAARIKESLQQFIDEYDSEQVFIIVRVDKSKEKDQITGLMQGDRMDLTLLLGHIIEKSEIDIEKFVQCLSAGLFKIDVTKLKREDFEFSPKPKE